MIRNFQLNPKYKDYFNARAQFDPAFDASIDEHFPKYLSGEINRVEYCELIAPALKAWSKALHPAWMAAGGS